MKSYSRYDALFMYYDKSSLAEGLRVFIFNVKEELDIDINLESLKTYLKRNNIKVKEIVKEHKLGKLNNTSNSSEIQKPNEYYSSVNMVPSPTQPSKQANLRANVSNPTPPTPTKPVEQTWYELKDGTKSLYETPSDIKRAIKRGEEVPESDKKRLDDFNAMVEDSIKTSKRSSNSTPLITPSLRELRWQAEKEEQDRLLAEQAELNSDNASLD